MIHRNDNSFKWVLVYTKPNSELTAKDNLENQNFLTFLPILNVLKGKEGTLIKRTALFPRYIFVRIDLENQNWGRIRSTKGVSHLVTFGKVPAGVPNKLMQELIDKVDEEGNFYQKIFPSDFHKGDEVLIEKGVLKNTIATFLSHKGRDRARILLEVMNHKATVDILISEISNNHSMELSKF